MENGLLQNLPKEVVQTMDTYIRDGKYVNDFRIIGNSRGFSITIHFCNKLNDLDPCWSPGITSSCAYKSPSNRRRDERRRLSFERSILNSIQHDNQQTVEYSNKAATSHNVSTGINICDDLLCGDIGDTVKPKDTMLCLDTVQPTVMARPVETVQSIGKAQHRGVLQQDIVQPPIFESDDKSGDVGEDGSDDRSDSQFCFDHKAHKVTSIEDYVEESPVVINTDSMTNSMPDEVDSSNSSDKEYRKHICDESRNKGYIKIVHEANINKVFGITDDLIIRIDEVKQQSSARPINNDEARALHSKINKAPAADPEQCEYGFKTLHDILPNIVKRQRTLVKRGNLT